MVNQPKANEKVLKTIRKHKRASPKTDSLQLVKKPSYDRKWSDYAGELEGAGRPRLGRPFGAYLPARRPIRRWPFGRAAGIKLDRMPRKPCYARIEASEARTFVLQSSTKVTAL
jgi:hypothetical protein